MRIAILGSGAREHALALALGSGGHDLWVLPGNAGTTQLGVNIDIDPENVDTVVAFARQYTIDLVVVGPEGPLAKGVVNRLSQAGIPAFGPTQAAAQIETSKSFALGLMSQAHIPHPASWVFSNSREVCAFVQTYGKPVVIKADGLAKGKGVWVCETYEEAARAAALCADLYPGPIIVQEFLSGREVSVFAFTDGYHLSSLVAACDYKRRDDGDRGPNTGGMGSYAWPEFWNKDLEAEAFEWVMKPAIRFMAQMEIPFSGMLYAGLMLTKDGLKVLEFNCRLGDPEAQVILPLFRGNLAKVMLSCAKGTLSSEPAGWDKTRSAVGVVVASPRYPDEDPSFLTEVPGVLRDGDAQTLILHGTTEFATDGRRIFARGGRMLIVVGKGRSVAEARELVYNRLEGIEFPHHSRGDIGKV
jgi:phosphoribosylamine---glycine ligase